MYLMFIYFYIIMYFTPYFCNVYDLNFNFNIQVW